MFAAVKDEKCDKAGRVLEAQHLHKDGVQTLLETVDADKLTKHNAKVFQYRIEEYVARTEHIKERVQDQLLNAGVVDNIVIEEDSSGHSYYSLFHKYFNAKVQEILIEEPNLQKYHQFQNFVVFLELAVKKCRKLKYVRVVTKRNKFVPARQEDAFAEIYSDLKERNIKLDIQYDDILNEAKIVLSNGFIIKIQRGLDIYQPLKLFEMGATDYDFRKCWSTEIEILHTQKLSQFNYWRF